MTEEVASTLHFRKLHLHDARIATFSLTKSHRLIDVIFGDMIVGWKDVRVISKGNKLFDIVGYRDIVNNDGTFRKVGND